MATSHNSGNVRFGVFEIDSDSGELRKQGVKIKLHEQPFQVLVMLLERPGEVVTRDELCQRLWPRDTFVESDLGLNSAIMKLRAALGDSAENPRFVETLPRRGYRLLVPVERLNGSPKLQSESPQVLENQPAQLTSPAADLSQSQLPASKANLPSLLTAAIATALVIATALGLWRLLRPAPAPRPGSYVIAVLPLKNLSPDSGSDYFSDGLTDEIINDLSSIDGLEVKSQTSSFSFKDKPRDIHTVGTQLGANLVLEGSVLRAGDKLRVNAQLVRVSDDHPLWSGQFERELKDIFDVQNEISRSIVNELRLKLGQGQRRYNTNLEAYDSYLKAIALTNSHSYGSIDKVAQSIPLYEAAIAKDSNFAPAYAGIANAYAYMSLNSRGVAQDVAYPKMKEACEKALQLDPLLAEAYACMGLVHSREDAWDQAEKDFLQSFRLNPNLSRARQDYGLFVLAPLGRIQEAERQIQTAIELDPLSITPVVSLDYILLIDRRYDKVVENSRRILATDPESYGARQERARALVLAGEQDEGIAVFEKLGDGSDSFRGFALAKAGRRADAEKILALHPNWPWTQALVNAGLGNKDQAMGGLEEMVAIKDPRAATYPLYPEFIGLRGEPRLNDMRRKQGLPEIH